MHVGQLDVRLPTLPEISRIKAFLCLDRNATRDYLDLAALASHQGFDAAVAALTAMDDLYPQKNGDTWAVRTQLVKQLADPRPYDLDSVDLSEYKGIRAPLNMWANVAEICASLSGRLTHEFTKQMKGDTSPDADTALASPQDWRGARECGERPVVPPLPGLKTT